ncbi:MAG: GAF domain-containing protein, partial [Oceanospirillaceae bacterium]
MLKKPAIPAQILTRWQRLVDIMGKVTDTPAALITQVHPQSIEMLVASTAHSNPYHERELSPRFCGLYCDKVVDQQQPLLVNNAADEPLWRNNPDMVHSLSFYLGYPLRWPDGEPFGTLCVLDNKENLRAKKYRDLIEEFQSIANEDLALIWMQSNQQHERLALEQVLDQQRMKIAERANDLAEINTAMRVLLKHTDQDRNSVKYEVFEEVKHLLKPWLNKLERSGLNREQKVYLSRIKEHLLVTRDASQQFYCQLTAMEQQVANAIGKGLSSKAI